MTTWVKRPTIARNTSGYSRREIMDALRMAGPKPSGSLLLDLTKSQKAYSGWCHYEAGLGWAYWKHNGKEYVADCHIRLRIGSGEIMPFWVWIKRGQRIKLHVTRQQLLALLLAHEIAHWRQAARDGKVRHLEVEADRAALRLARKLGLVRGTR